MTNRIVIPPRIAGSLRDHLFQDNIEQGAFLFASPDHDGEQLILTAMDHYLVPPEGWELQLEIYLQMKDSERAKIMGIARENGLCAIDCHSHPNSGSDVWFSPSDKLGISEFAPYAKWKLGGRPFAAIVFGEESLDTVVWQGDFESAEPVTSVDMDWGGHARLTPTGSWFREPKGIHRYATYENESI